MIFRAAVTQVHTFIPSFLLWKGTLYTPRTQEPTTNIPAGCWEMPTAQDGPGTSTTPSSAHLGWTVGNPQPTPNTHGWAQHGAALPEVPA